MTPLKASFNEEHALTGCIPRTKYFTHGLLKKTQSCCLEIDCYMHFQASHQKFTDEARSALRRALADSAGAKVSGVAIEGVQRAKAGIRVALTVATGADVLAAQRLVRQLQVWHAAHALPLGSAVPDRLQDPGRHCMDISRLTAGCTHPIANGRHLHC